MALVPVLALRKYCGPDVSSGSCAFHKPCGHCNPCDRMYFYKYCGPSCYNHHSYHGRYSRHGYHGCHSRHGNRGHCDTRSRPNASGMSLCGWFHANSLMWTVLHGLPPANIVRLYCTYSF